MVKISTSQGKKVIAEIQCRRPDGEKSISWEFIETVFISSN